VTDTADPVAAFIEAACVPLDSGHGGSGTLDRPQSILAEHPEVASSNIHMAAILGDDERVRRFLERDPAAATAKGSPRGWDALTHLCFSRYLRLDQARSSGFVRTATALLDLGVNVGALFKEGDVYFDVAPNSMAIHVAAGRANHGTVKLLIERGSPIDASDGKGRTLLALAVKACVDSYWTERRTPESVEALLRAGAPVSGTGFPSGYAEVDELLRSYQS